MAKNEARTMGVILDELNINVNTYNELDAIDPKRVELADEAKKLVNEYNELSLLTTYAKCMEAELPLKALVETFSYNTVGVKYAPHPKVVDGVKRTIYSGSITEKPSMLDITKFLTWAAEGNKQVAHEKDWKVKMRAAKVAIKTEWKKYLESKGESTSISNRKMKEAMQNMFDALLFIPTENNNNAVIASNKIARFAFATANKLNPKIDADASDIDILPESNWKVIQMKIMRTAVIGKELVINYNNDEDEVEELQEEVPAKKDEEVTAK